MLRPPSDYRQEIIDKVTQCGQCTLAFIDPGTNTAVRYISLSAPQGAPLFLNTAQEFYRCKGKSAGDGYAENSALLTKLLLESPHFRTADFYFIENQYEKNVTITLGLILGALAAARSSEIVTEERKRAGGHKIKHMPYRIIGLPTTYKGATIEELTPEPEGPPLKGPARSANLKERAVQAATLICQRDQDLRTLSLMAESQEAHDIADTVCYAEALSRYLASGKEPAARKARAPPKAKAPRASRQPTK